MYRDYQTLISQDCLNSIIEKISQPPCLLGGWAVYLHLNEKFQSSKGREYLGSRDIDLGFHLDPNWSSEEYAGSDLRRTIDNITSMGFEPVSFRFVKHFSENGKELTIDQAKRRPRYEIFDLYIDLMVDTSDTRHHKIVGFTIAEEPLLEEIFLGKQITKVKYFDTEVIIPNPTLLMEMKIISFPNRTQDDKRTKDLTDICALLLYSGQKPLNLSDRVNENKKNDFVRAISRLPEGEWDRVASILDEDKRDLKRVINEIPI